MSRKIITLETLLRFKEDYDKKLSSDFRNAIDDSTIVLNEQDKYTLNEFLKGGYLVVQTLAERSLIPSTLLKRGSLVKVNENKLVYEWDGVNWHQTGADITGIGTGLVISAGGILSVDTTDEAIKNNKQPISSHGVYVILGDITDRLEEI